MFSLSNSSDSRKVSGFGLFGFDLPVDSFYQSRGREFEWAYLGGNAQSHGVPIISFGQPDH
jgi:hypothetical protein